MVDVHVLDRPEVDRAASGGARLELVGVVVEPAAGAVEHEPAPAPGGPRQRAAPRPVQLGQVAVAGARRQLHEPRAAGQAVPGRLDELTEVERSFADRQVPRQRPSQPLHQANRTEFRVIMPPP